LPKQRIEAALKFVVWLTAIHWDFGMDGPDTAAQELHAAQDLVREANHRIANQLALLTGMIQIQIDGLKRGPDLLSRQHVSDLLRNAAGRIVAIGHLHRRLASTSNEQLDLGPFLASSCLELRASLTSDDRVRVTENLSADCHVTAEQASVLCLVMNEVLVNALKYAHPDGSPIAMCLSCGPDGGQIIVEIADDGVGLPEGFDEERDGGVGFKLIRNLLLKIGAALDLLSSPQGLSFRITLPPAIPR
jgi:two-component sensor histidine kinase